MPGSVKATVNQPISNSKSKSSSRRSTDYLPLPLGQVASKFLLESFGDMPASHGTVHASSSPKDSIIDSKEFLCKLAQIVLRARIPSDQLHQLGVYDDTIINTNLLEAWTSGRSVHIDIYRQDVLLERWISSLDTASSQAGHGTHQDLILLLQSIYAHTRLMPIQPLLANQSLTKDQLSFSLSSADSPYNSPRTPSSCSDRREFKSDAKLKVFQFQSVHMSHLGIIKLEVVFDENVGTDKNDIQQRIESLHLNDHSSIINTDKSESTDYFGIPILENSAKRKATSPFPSPGHSQKMINRSLQRHAASHLARQHTNPVVKLMFRPPPTEHSPERSPSPSTSNLANLFSQQQKPCSPSDIPDNVHPDMVAATDMYSDIAHVHPLQKHTSTSSIAEIPLSPPRSMGTSVHHSIIAKRRLSRLSLSAMEQEAEDLLEEDTKGIAVATSTSMQFTHQGTPVAYSTSPSYITPPKEHGYLHHGSVSHHNHLHLHAAHVHAHTAFSAHASMPRRSSIVHGSPTFPSRRNSLGLHHGELFGSLVGSYEESILNGRMSTLPSKPITFHAQIGVLGHGACKPSLRCPPHVTLVFPSYFYELEDTDSPTPYVGTIDLETGLTGDRFKRKPGYYRLPPKGQIQIVIKNPNKTAVKLFLIPYDLSDMPAETKTFLRQKSFGVPESNRGDDSKTSSKATLRYAIHLQACCTEKKHIYLFKHIRVVFANRASNEKLHVVCEDPGVPKYVPLT
ncbi:hypothetical protein NQZ79_g1404 [Umbelopsis isabellina]|nr:hypothetical protein NQZ79_g1404 [Umbelopsis isabellina]